MSSNLSRDPLSTLRQTITALDNDPEPLTPQLLALRELLDNRLRRLEAETPSPDPELIARTPNKRP
jgi:hypothetical protein